MTMRQPQLPVPQTNGLIHHMLSLSCDQSLRPLFLSKEALDNPINVIRTILPVADSTQVAMKAVKQGLNPCLSPVFHSNIY